MFHREFVTHKTILTILCHRSRVLVINIPLQNLAKKIHSCCIGKHVICTKYGEKLLYHLLVSKYIPLLISLLPSQLENKPEHKSNSPKEAAQKNISKLKGKGWIDDGTWCCMRANYMERERLSVDSGPNQIQRFLLLWFGTCEWMADTWGGGEKGVIFST